MRQAKHRYVNPVVTTTLNADVTRQKVAEALEAIHEKYGELKPGLVVDEARDSSHPLHSYFEWNDGLAAERWRLNQAGQLIRKIRLRVVTEGGEEITTPRYLSVQYKGDEDRADHRYVKSEVAMADPLTRETIIRRAQQDIRSWTLRYESLCGLAACIELLGGEAEALTARLE